VAGGRLSHQQPGHSQGLHPGGGYHPGTVRVRQGASHPPGVGMPPRPTACLLAVLRCCRQLARHPTAVERVKAGGCDTGVHHRHGRQSHSYYNHGTWRSSTHLTHAAVCVNPNLYRRLWWGASWAAVPSTHSCTTRLHVRRTCGAPAAHALSGVEAEGGCGLCTQTDFCA
jgi:hypothetical protein